MRKKSDRLFPYGNTVLITGASSGIGMACARAFASEGYIVYATSRTIKEGEEEYGKGRIISTRSDVRDIPSLTALRDRIGNVGIIIHSAGFGIAGSAEDTPDEMARKQFDTNYFGVLNVERVFMPLLRKNTRSLVIGISSIAGRVPIPYQSHYSGTKYALEAHWAALRMEASRFGVRVTIIEPGDTATGFTSGRVTNLDPVSPYTPGVKAGVEVMERDEENGVEASTIARTALRLSRRTNPPVRVAAGWKYKALMFLLRVLPDRAVLSILAKLYKA